MGVQQVPDNASIQEPTQLVGIIDGAEFKIEIPPNWNGTLLLYSHPTVPAGSANPAVNAPDAAIAAWLLSSRFALAGSSFRSTGYAVVEAISDNLALLDHFESVVGKPKRTV